MLAARYMQWLHTSWPAGTVEKLPQVNDDGTTAVTGVRVVGDLTGVPLLKFAADSGARAVQAILEEKLPKSGSGDTDLWDLAIVGGGVAGMSAAIVAQRSGLRLVVLEASQPFSTIVNFPKGKPIFTYPTDMTPAGDMRLTSETKEDLVAELERQRFEAGIEPLKARVERIERKKGELLLHHGGKVTRARRVIVAIGRGGNFRRLGVEGQDLQKVYNRLHDPKEFAGHDVLVVGGGDSAIEASIALALAGAKVTHSYRGETFSRPKTENVEKLEQIAEDPRAPVGVEEPTSKRVARLAAPAMRDRPSSQSLDQLESLPHAGEGSIRLALSSQLVAIREREVVLKGGDGADCTIPNDVVFSMIGREPPLDFFRRSGIPIRGEWRMRSYLAFGLFLAFCVFVYHWKTTAYELPIHRWFQERGWFPFNVAGLLDAFGVSVSAAAERETSILFTLKRSMADGGFYYTLAYCICVVSFGIRRITRRRTPYVTLQTITLMMIQCVPLFLLPQILLPWAGQNGWLSGGPLGWVADQLFPNGEYWRAYGLILAWPLFIYNLFTDQPIWVWLVLSFLQTCVIIPLLVRRWGKGAYCGWICSCGALAETLGDTHRHKMPHGPIFNRLNMTGQVVLGFAVVLLIVRIIGWIWPGSVFATVFTYMLKDLPFINYKWLVDIMLAGVLGLGCYFWFSGRVWCRFACPLAALMHIYARFSRFRIFCEKAKCISCNVCTSVCHQGIDVMNFANKGIPMEDPQCVRCSACVQSCPTGVLSFGRFDSNGEMIHDRLPASPVRLQEVAGICKDGDTSVA